MNAGKMLFSQLMDCLPWNTFARIVARYHGDHSVQTFPCTVQYRALAFAEFVCSDIEPCLEEDPLVRAEAQANLTRQQRFRLRDLLRYNLRTPHPAAYWRLTLRRSRQRPDRPL